MSDTASDSRWQTEFALFAPSAAVSLFFDQNSILSTVLLGGGVLFLGWRPILAGVLAGLMASKPQFTLLLSFALIARRECFNAACIFCLSMFDINFLLRPSAFWNNSRGTLSNSWADISTAISGYIHFQRDNALVSKCRTQPNLQ